jgi:hypothetical protein
MRPTASLLISLIAAFGLPACSSTSNTSNASLNTADTTAASRVAAATNAPGDGTTPPVYPGAALSIKPEMVAASSQPSAKAYVSGDALAKVIAWYKSALPDASEMSDPGDKTTDVFMIPGGKSGMVVVVQAYGGKTWIVIGPGFPQ